MLFTESESDEALFDLQGISPWVEMKALWWSGFKHLLAHIENGLTNALKHQLFNDDAIFQDK